MIVYLNKNKPVEVATFAQASKVIYDHWSHKKSSDRYYRDPKAGLIEMDGKVIAHVSYNGRVWEGGDRFMSGAKEIPV